MHLFEAILIVLAGQLALAVAVLGGRSPQRANLLPLFLLAPLAAHLALDGFRWQMTPAYAAVAGFCIVGIIRSSRGGALRAHVALTATGIADFLLLMLSAAGVAFFR